MKGDISKEILDVRGAADRLFSQIDGLENTDAAAIRGVNEASLKLFNKIASIQASGIAITLGDAMLLSSVRSKTRRKMADRAKELQLSLIYAETTQPTPGTAKPNRDVSQSLPLTLLRERDLPVSVPMLAESMLMLRQSSGLREKIEELRKEMGETLKNAIAGPEKKLLAKKPELKAFMDSNDAFCEKKLDEIYAVLILASDKLDHDVVEEHIGEIRDGLKGRINKHYANPEDLSAGIKSPIEKYARSLGIITASSDRGEDAHISIFTAAEPIEVFSLNWTQIIKREVDNRGAHPIAMAGASGDVESSGAMPGAYFGRGEGAA